MIRQYKEFEGERTEGECDDTGVEGVRAVAEDGRLRQFRS